MATKEQIFEWIRYTCVTDTDAEQVAEIVATKLAEENGSSHNSAMVPCLKHIEYKSYFEMLRYRLCPYCGFDLAQHQ